MGHRRRPSCRVDGVDVLYWARVIRPSGTWELYGGGFFRVASSVSNRIGASVFAGGLVPDIFRKIACAADGSCDLRLSSKSQKVGLVLVTVLIGGFIAYPQLSVISMKLADNETAADPVASVGQNIVAEPTPVIEAGTKRSVSAPVRGAALEEVTEAAILEVDIASMTCPACAYGIEKALVNKPGVKSVSIDYANKSGRIRYDEAVLTADQLIAAIDASGFKAERRNQETGAP